MTVIEIGGGDDVVTLTCPDCPETFTGNRTGKGSASLRLGQHRFREHGYRSSKRKSRTSTAPTGEDFAEAPVVSIVRDMGDQARGRGVPTAEQLTHALGRGLGLTTIAVASWAAETDPTIVDGPEGEAQRNRIVDDLSLSQKGADDVMRPLAKAFADTGLNKRYGRQIVDNVDVVASIAELTKLGLSWKRYFRIRGEVTAQMRPIDAASYPVFPAAPPVAVEGGPPAGIVLGADAEARRQASEAL